MKTRFVVPVLYGGGAVVSAVPIQRCFGMEKWEHVRKR